VEAWARRNDPRLRYQLVALSLFVIASTAFAKIVEDYLNGDPIVRWDVHFASWLHEHSSSALVSVFKVVTLAGNVAVLAALTLVVAAWLLRRRLLHEAVLLCAVALGIEILNAVLKLAFQRPRPELAYVHLDTYSFPSGHAAGSSAIYGVLAFLVARRLQILGRILCVLALVVLVCVVAFSRLYLEVHYLSDVLAGIALGTAWFAALLFMYQRYRERNIVEALPKRVRSLISRVAGT
jgi:undecaprenyl-diphosphatase